MAWRCVLGCSSARTLLRSSGAAAARCARSRGASGGRVLSEAVAPCQTTYPCASRPIMSASAVVAPVVAAQRLQPTVVELVGLETLRLPDAEPAVPLPATRSDRGERAVEHRE